MSPTSRRRAAPALRTALALRPALALTLLLAACGGSQTSTPAPQASGADCAAAPSVADDLTGWSGLTTPKDLIPVQITNTLVCGANRVLFSFVDDSGRPIATPDRRATFAFFELGRNPGAAIASAEGTFVWAIEGAVGIYVTNVSFPESGRYGVEVGTSIGSNPATTIRMTFDVRTSTDVVRVGDAAPASKTPTLADVGGDPAKLSTDPSPDPALYETSVDQALAAHRPFVLVFATPKFCTSRQCGPTLDRIKPFIARYPSVAFINVEPYQLSLVDGALQPVLSATGDLQQAPTTSEWHLVNEPSVYVVDKAGVVTANYELIFSDAELTSALDAVK